MHGLGVPLQKARLALGARLLERESSSVACTRESHTASSLPSLSVGTQGWLKQLFEACARFEVACVGVGVQGTSLDEMTAKRCGRRSRSTRL
eukprot:3274635-Pleurochrysis_carterae.AAC.1